MAQFIQNKSERAKRLEKGEKGERYIFALKPEK
jgi:hypothetical protein